MPARFATGPSVSVATRRKSLRAPVTGYWRAGRSGSRIGSLLPEIGDDHAPIDRGVGISPIEQIAFAFADRPQLLGAE